MWFGGNMVVVGMHALRSACVSGGAVARRWHALGPHAVAVEAGAAVPVWWAGVSRRPAWGTLLGGSFLLSLGAFGVSLAPQVWLPPEGGLPTASADVPCIHPR